MVRKIWYRHLAIADRLIVEARECIDNQKQQLRALKHDQQDTEGAAATLKLLEQTLHLMHWHRATILEKVAAYKGFDFGPAVDGRDSDVAELSEHRLQP